MTRRGAIYIIIIIIIIIISLPHPHATRYLSCFQHFKAYTASMHDHVLYFPTRNKKGGILNLNEITLLPLYSTLHARSISSFIFLYLQLTTHISTRFEFLCSGFRSLFGLSSLIRRSGFMFPQKAVNEIISKLGCIFPVLSKSPLSI